MQVVAECEVKPLTFDSEDEKIEMALKRKAKKKR